MEDDHVHDYLEETIRDVQRRCSHEVLFKHQGTIIWPRNFGAKYKDYDASLQLCGIPNFLTVKKCGNCMIQRCYGLGDGIPYNFCMLKKHYVKLAVETGYIAPVDCGHSAVIWQQLWLQTPAIDSLFHFLAQIPWLSRHSIAFVVFWTSKRWIQPWHTANNYPKHVQRCQNKKLW